MLLLSCACSRLCLSPCIRDVSSLRGALSILPGNGQNLLWFGVFCWKCLIKYQNLLSWLFWPYTIIMLYYYYYLFYYVILKVEVHFWFQGGRLPANLQSTQTRFVFPEIKVLTLNVPLEGWNPLPVLLGFFFCFVFYFFIKQNTDLLGYAW